MIIHSILQVIIFILFNFCDASDITLNSAFGCQWTGGMTPGVACICRDDQAWIINNNIPIYNTAYIKIINCKNVTFTSDSIEKLRLLRSIELENISQLEFEENGLRWFGHNKNKDMIDMNLPSIEIRITNCNVSRISKQAFSGRFRKIMFDKTTIIDTFGYAFKNLLQTELLQFKETLFLKIRPRAFVDFVVVRLQLHNVTAGVVPSQMFTDVRVYESVEIKNCNFKTVHSLAFDVITTAFILRDTIIHTLEVEAFRVIGAINILVKNNIFYQVNNDAFIGLTPANLGSNKNTFIFDSNTITKLDEGSLTFVETPYQITNLNINRTCDCQAIEDTLKQPDFYSEIQCLYENNYMTIEQFKTNFCSFIQTNKNNIIIGSVSGGIFIIVAIALTIYFMSYFRSRNYDNSQQNRQIGLVVPDGKTFRETQFHISVERKDLLTTDL